MEKLQQQPLIRLEFPRIIKLSIGSDHRLWLDSDNTRLHPGTKLLLSIATNSTGEEKLGQRLCQNISPCTCSLTPGLLQLQLGTDQLTRSDTCTTYRVQHSTARLIRNLRRQDSVLLMELHWLPLHHRITFKLCTLMHGIHHGLCPKYMRLWFPCRLYRATSAFRSATTLNYDIRRTKLNFSERAFAVAAPKAWNSLPDFLKQTNDVLKIRKTWKPIYLTLHTINWRFCVTVGLL